MARAHCALDGKKWVFMYCLSANPMPKTANTRQNKWPVCFGSIYLNIMRHFVVNKVELFFWYVDLSLWAEMSYYCYNRLSGEIWVLLPAPLTRVNDYLTTTSAIASPLYSRHTFTRASHGLMTCRSQLARVSATSMIYRYCTREKMLEWQSSRLAPLATQFAVVVIIVRRWGRQRWACRNPTSVPNTEQGWQIGSLNESAKTSRRITSQEVQIIDSGWSGRGMGVFRKKCRMHPWSPGGYNVVM